MAQESLSNSVILQITREERVLYRAIKMFNVPDEDILTKTKGPQAYILKE